MHNIFISYHHNDQIYKDALPAMNGIGNERIFIDGSVDTGDISDDLSDELTATISVVPWSKNNSYPFRQISPSFFNKTACYP